MDSGLEASQLSESAVVRTFRGIDAALEASENIERAAEDGAERRVGIFGFAEFIGPELSLHATEAAKLPVGVDQSIDQETFKGRRRLELAMIFFGKRVELFGVFAGNDLGFCGDAGFQGIEAG